MIMRVSRSNCIQYHFRPPIGMTRHDSRAALSRAYVRELELHGREVGGVGLIEVQLQYVILDLVSHIVGLEDHGIIVMVVAVDLIELSGTAVPATANGEVQAVLTISYGLDRWRACSWRSPSSRQTSV